MKARLNLYHLTVAILAFKAFFFVILTVVIWFRSGIRAGRADRRRAVEECSVMAMTLSLAGVSAADMDLVRATHNVVWWRTLIRVSSLFAAWGVLATLVLEWPQDRDGAVELRQVQ